MARILIPRRGVKCIALTALLLAAGAVRADPYVALSIVGAAPEVALGYATRYLDLEAATFGEQQLGSVFTVATFEEWTVRGERVTARVRVPIAQHLEVTAAANAYRLRYEHSRIDGSVATVKHSTTGLSLGLRYAINERFSIHAEAMRANTPPEAFNLQDVRELRLGAAFTF